MKQLITDRIILKGFLKNNDNAINEIKMLKKIKVKKKKKKKKVGFEPIPKYLVSEQRAAAQPTALRRLYVNWSN